MSDILTLPVIITEAGRDAAIAAEALGLQVALTHFALGDGAEIPETGWTALPDERERFEVLGGKRVAPAHLQLHAVAQSDAAYTVRQIGIVTSDGVLFAVGWRVAGIVAKSSGIPYALNFDLRLIDVPEEAIAYDATLTLDLAFLGSIAALTMAVANLTTRQIEQEIRLRRRERRATGGMEKVLLP